MKHLTQKLYDSMRRHDKLVMFISNILMSLHRKLHIWDEEWYDNLQEYIYYDEDE